MIAMMDTFHGSYLDFLILRGRFILFLMEVRGHWKSTEFKNRKTIKTVYKDRNDGDLSDLV